MEEDSHGSSEGKRIEISVSLDGDDTTATLYYEGLRVKVDGSLTFRKRGDALYFNLRCEGAPTLNPQEPDGIAGTLDFRVTLGGKPIEERMTRKNEPMLLLNGFSTEKVGNSFEYTWLRLIGFNIPREAWLQPKAKVEGNGKLQVDAYNGRINLTCVISDIREYVKPTGYGQ